MLKRSVAELAVLLTFVEAVCAGAAAAPLAALLGPFTDAELLEAGSPYALEALRLARPRLPEVAPAAVAWFAVGLLCVSLVRAYAYRRTAALAGWRTEGRPRVGSFLLLSFVASLVKWLLLATAGLLAVNAGARGPSAWWFGFASAAVLLGVHASVAAWLDASRVLVSVGASPFGALARGTSVVTSARLVTLRGALALTHLGLVPLGYLAVALTEGGTWGAVASAGLQALLFSLCFAEVRWIHALGEPLKLAEPRAHAEPSATGA